MAGLRLWVRRLGLRSGVMKRRWRLRAFLCWRRIRGGGMERGRNSLGVTLRILGMGIFATSWLGLRNRFRRRRLITIAWELPGGVTAGFLICWVWARRGGF